jgi:hypothetical protein
VTKYGVPSDCESKEVGHPFRPTSYNCFTLTDGNDITAMGLAGSTWKPQLEPHHGQFHRKVWAHLAEGEIASCVPGKNQQNLVSPTTQTQSHTLIFRLGHARKCWKIRGPHHRHSAGKVDSRRMNLARIFCPSLIPCTSLVSAVPAVPHHLSAVTNPNFITKAADLIPQKFPEFATIIGTTAVHHEGCPCDWVYKRSRDKGRQGSITNFNINTVENSRSLVRSESSQGHASPYKSKV